ncbi:spore-wall fungal hydrophobin dewA [Aspergillus terricola var. indicus]
MRFIVSVLAFTAAATATALPASAAKNAKLATSAAFAKQSEGTTCDVGSIACCNSPAETNNDGLLSGLLGAGLLNGLSGNTGSACAKASLIDQLGLLALVDHTETGPVCKNIVACCPEGTTTCVAADYAGAGTAASE